MNVATMLPLNLKKMKNMHFCSKGPTFFKISQILFCQLGMYNHFHITMFEERIASKRKGPF